MVMSPIVKQETFSEIERKKKKKEKRTGQHLLTQFQINEKFHLIHISFTNATEKYNLFVKESIL